MEYYKTVPMPLQLFGEDTSGIKGIQSFREKRDFMEVQTLRRYLGMGFKLNLKECVRFKLLEQGCGSHKPVKEFTDVLGGEGQQQENSLAETVVVFPRGAASKNGQMVWA